MTHATTPELDPPCPAVPAELTTPGARPPTFTDATAPAAALRAVRRPFDRIERDTWDALAAANPWATPFSSWGVQRAWWDAYGDNAHDQTLVVMDDAAPRDAPPVAIVPLMHRHEVEPDDAILRTRMRGAGHSAPLTPVAPETTSRAGIWARAAACAWSRRGRRAGQPAVAATRSLEGTRSRSASGIPCAPASRTRVLG